MTGIDFREILTIALVLLSALMCAAAGVGLMRFPDVLSRLHAATKPQILGLMAITLDIAVSTPDAGTIALVIAVIIFQGLTAPIAAHMVGRAAYRTDHLRRDLLIRDDLAARMDGAEPPAGDTGTPSPSES